MSRDCRDRQPPSWQPRSLKAMLRNRVANSDYCLGDCYCTAADSFLERTAAAARQTAAELSLVRIVTYYDAGGSSAPGGQRQQPQHR